jgi:hypothetical protein
MVLISGSEVTVIRSLRPATSLPEPATSEQPVSQIICEFMTFASYKDYQNQEDL